MISRINGIQHIGVAVADMDKSLKFYRKHFGLDIPFFDAVAPAPLMDIYTKNETITKRASMVLNLQGGCAMEVISPTSFKAKGPKNTVQVGDLGIFITQVKCKDLRRAYEFCKQEGTTILGEISKMPNAEETFYIADPDGNIFQYLHSNEWYQKSKHHSGGTLGCTIGVSDMEAAFKLYKDVLGYDDVLYDKTDTFADWAGLPSGTETYRRVKLGQSAPPGGGFAKVAGNTYIELVEAKSRKSTRIFEDRIWADLGFVHLGFDVKGMAELGKKLEAQGFGFTTDSNDALDMGNTKVHCTYIDDPDQTWLELIEVYKVPIIEKFGIYLNVEKRDPAKPLPDFMLKALRFSRIVDN